MTAPVHTFIRPATLADARAIGTLLVRSWQTAYRGILPDALLDSLDSEARVRSWERILSPSGSASTTSVAEAEGRIAGCCGVGPSRDDGAAGTIGEVWLIYVDPAYVRHGIGTQLFEHGVGQLRVHRFNEATLWVLESNAPARSFYEKQGWSWDGARKIEQRGRYALREIRYRGPLFSTR